MRTRLVRGRRDPRPHRRRRRRALPGHLEGRVPARRLIGERHPLPAGARPVTLGYAPVQTKEPRPRRPRSLSAVQGAGPRRRRRLHRLRLGHARPVPAEPAPDRAGGPRRVVSAARRAASAPSLRAMSLFGRVVAINAGVLVAAALALALSPATVSDAPADRRGRRAGPATLVVLTVNLLLVRRVFGPLERLTAIMRRIDPHAPGRRLALDRRRRRGRRPRHAFNAMLDRLEDERRVEQPPRAGGAGGRAQPPRARAARRDRADADRRRAAARGPAARRAGRRSSRRSRSCRRRPAPAWRTCARSRAACGPRRSTSSGCAARWSRSPRRSPTAAACASARSSPPAARARRPSSTSRSSASPRRASRTSPATPARAT